VRVVVRIALVASSVLSILHVVLAYTFDAKLGNTHCQFRVKRLLVIRKHRQPCADCLVAIDAKRFSNEEPCLVPVSGWMFWSRVQNYFLIRSCKKSVEVHGIPVQDRCLSHRVREL